MWPGQSQQFLRTKNTINGAVLVCILVLRCVLMVGESRCWYAGAVLCVLCVCVGGGGGLGAQLKVKKCLLHE